MSAQFFVLAKFSDWFPWYTWVMALALVAILVAYKLYQRRQM